ncbi:hypothetical protein V1509DRAFT_614338 [Lipomyces kononenkoae]
MLAILSNLVCLMLGILIIAMDVISGIGMDKTLRTSRLSIYLLPVLIADFFDVINSHEHWQMHRNLLSPGSLLFCHIVNFELIAAPRNLNKPKLTSSLSHAENI